MITNRLLPSLCLLLLTGTLQAQWTPIVTGVGGNIESIDFVGNTGLFSQSGTIARSTDGGTTWAPVATGALYRDVSMVDATTAYAAGVSSTAVYRSVNGGLNWTQITPVPNSNSLWGVSGTSPGRAFFCGTGNVVWRLDGNLFTPVNISFSPALTMTDIDFTDDQHGCVLGDGGKVWTTFNAGATWTLSYTTTGTLMQAVHFPSPQRGYAVGGGGLVIRTTDGGVSWTALNAGTTAFLTSIHFSDDLHGLAVGFSGTVLYTANGGDTWTNLPAPTTANLRSAYLFSASNGIVAGETGVMFRSTALGVGIEDLTTPPVTVEVWPNPAADQLSVKLPQHAGTVRQAVVIDALGRTSSVPMLQTLQTGAVPLDLRGLATGTYQVILTTALGHSYRSSFVKGTP